MQLIMQTITTVMSSILIEYLTIIAQYQTRLSLVNWEKKPENSSLEKWNNVLFFKKKKGLKYFNPLTQYTLFNRFFRVLA